MGAQDFHRTRRPRAGGDPDRAQGERRDGELDRCDQGSVLMLRFSANLSFLFTDLPLPERIDAAAANGFRGVEYMSPYESDLGDLRARLQRHGIEQVLFNLPMGD